jgi:hypothetical protein
MPSNFLRSIGVFLKTHSIRFSKCVGLRAHYGRHMQGSTLQYVSITDFNVSNMWVRSIPTAFSQPAADRQPLADGAQPPTCRQMHQAPGGRPGRRASWRGTISWPGSAPGPQPRSIPARESAPVTRHQRRAQAPRLRRSR